MRNPVTIALRQAAFTFVAKAVLLCVFVWFIGWENLNTPVWTIALGIALWCGSSSWEVYREWREHFRRKNQWKTPKP